MVFPHPPPPALPQIVLCAVYSGDIVDAFSIMKTQQRRLCNRYDGANSLQLLVSIQLYAAYI